MRFRALPMPVTVLTATLSACAVAVLAAQGPAEASFPGENGKLVYQKYKSNALEPSGIYSVEPDGTGETQLTDNTTGGRDMQPSVSPDGTKIAFLRSFYYDASPDGYVDLYTMNIDGTGLRKITDERVAYSATPTWSPDGRKVAFRGGPDGEIHIANADGSGERRITSGPLEKWDIAWSPRGDKIAFSARSDVSGGDAEIYVVDLDGSEQVRLTDNAASDIHPDWSPDGERLAFTSDRDGRDGIWTMAADGSEQQKVNVDMAVPNGEEFVGDSDPDWSPDGTRVAFTRIRLYPVDHGEGLIVYNHRDDIFTADVDGSGLKDLPSFYSDVEVDWQPLTDPGLTPNEAPGTTIISGPSGTKGTTASFDFVASGLGSSFECSLDGAGFAPCAGPKRYDGLSGGEHTFAVRARNAAGADQTPATRTWTVDATAPRGRVVINGGRASTTNRRVFLTLSASDAGSGMAAMRLGGGGTGRWTAWRPYAERATWNLAGPAGTKSVRFRFRDGAGNVSSASDSIVYRP